MDKKTNNISTLWDVLHLKEDKPQEKISNLEAYSLIHYDVLITYKIYYTNWYVEKQHWKERQTSGNVWVSSVLQIFEKVIARNQDTA